MSAEFTEADMAAVESAAKIIASRYKIRGTVEYSDLTQECWVWLLENYARVIEWRESLDEHVAQQTLIKALRNACGKYARSETEYRFGLQVNEGYYSVPVMENMLRLYFNPDLLTEDSAHVANIVADVGFAYENTFAEDDRETLRAVYASGEPKANVASLAEEWEIPYEAARLRVCRRIARLCDQVEGPNEYKRVRRG